MSEPSTVQNFFEQKSTEAIIVDNFIYCLELLNCPATVDTQKKHIETFIEDIGKHPNTFPVK